MLLAYHRGAIDALRPPTVEGPWRLLISGCLAAWPCGVDGTDFGMGAALGGLLSLPTLRVLPFCPEQAALGTPRTVPDIHDGDGVDVIEGRARVIDENGNDVTEKVIAGARLMLDYALQERAELAVLTDMSAACGSQVISNGPRLVPVRSFQKGVGVATALLLKGGIPVVSQRDFQTLSLLRQRLDPTYQPGPNLHDHHEHPWTLEHLPLPHPRS